MVEMAPDKPRTDTSILRNVLNWEKADHNFSHIFRAWHCADEACFPSDFLGML